MDQIRWLNPRSHLASAVIRRARLVFFWVLRAFFPVCRLRGKVWITRCSDVRQVLSSPVFYSVRHYGSRMRDTGADFFLGIDDHEPERGSRRENERSLSQRAMKTLGAERAGVIARAETEAILGRHRPAPEGASSVSRYLDVIADLGNDVPVRVAEKYFGLRNPGGRTLLEWMQLGSWFIFNPFSSDADRERAIRAGDGLREHVYREVRAAREVGRNETVLDLLIAFGLDDDAAARTITGLVSGSLGPPPRFFAKAVNRLLSLRGGAWRDLAGAARNKELGAVGQYLLEAARLDPSPSLIYRACEVSGATLRGHPIHGGEVVVCAIQSALRDGRSVRDPFQFRLERPPEERMLFGHGPHWCIGQSVGIATLTGMAQPLFALPGLMRAPGRSGRLRNGEPGDFPAQDFPAHLGVVFEGSP